MAPTGQETTALRDKATVRILIVDDDVDAAAGVKDILEMEGHVVGMAHDGTNALQSALMMTPEVALIDLRLKGEWGLDVAQTLRSKFPDIVSVVMTGESDAAVVISALRQGVYDYLTKPFDPDQLVLVVDRAADKVKLQNERHEMMEQLAQARDRAELASRSKTEFLTRMSGQLGEHLGSVVNLAKTISDQQLGEIGNPAYIHCANGIADGCRRMSRVMMWIGELGQLEAGAMRVNRKLFDLEAVVNGVMGIFSKLMAERDIGTSVKVSPNLPPVNSDPDHFARILGHLVSNAVKFSPAGQSIDVSVMVDGFGDLRIDVADHGPGIAEGDLDQALAPFGRLQQEGVQDPFGVGLGLPLADRFTGLLGGKMTVASAPNEGTRVELRFSRDQVFQGAETLKSA